MSRWLALFALLLPSVAHAQDSLRISERVGNTLDADERAYFSVLPRLDASATVWMRNTPTGAQLVVQQPARADSLVALTPEDRSTLALYLDAFESEGEATLRRAVAQPEGSALPRLVRYRSTVQPRVPVTRMRVRGGETLRGRLLTARNGQIAFWPHEDPYAWQRVNEVRVFDVRDVAWVEGQAALPRLAAASALVAGAAAGAFSSAVAEDRTTAGAVHLLNFAVLSVDAFRPSTSYDRIVLNGQPERLRRAANAVRPVELFWLGAMPPELIARLAAGAETVPSVSFSSSRPAPQRWHVALSTPRNVAPTANVGTIEYAVPNSTTTITLDAQTERAASAFQADVFYALSTRGGLGVLGLVDQRIADKPSIGTRRLKGWEAYLYGEAYAVPLPERALPMGQRLSVGVGAGVGRIQVSSTFNSGYVSGTYPAFYEIPQRPENDPAYLDQQSTDFSSVALLGRLGAEWRLTPRTSVRLSVAHHFVPSEFKLEGLTYTYRVTNGFVGTLLRTPSYTVRLSHTDVNVGLRLHF